MLPVEPYYITGQGPITNTRRETTSSLWTCGQRKRVAHMSTATTTKDDSSSKMVQNHPLVCLKRRKRNGPASQERGQVFLTTLKGAPNQGQAEYSPSNGPAGGIIR